MQCISKIRRAEASGLTDRMMQDLFGYITILLLEINIFKSLSLHGSEGGYELNVSEVGRNQNLRASD